MKEPHEPPSSTDVSVPASGTGPHEGHIRGRGYPACPRPFHFSSLIYAGFACSSRTTEKERVFVLREKEDLRPRQLPHPSEGKVTPAQSDPPLVSVSSAAVDFAAPDVSSRPSASSCPHHQVRI